MRLPSVDQTQVLYLGSAMIENSQPITDSPEQLLPHRSAMMLLTEALDASDCAVSSRTVLSEKQHGLFVRNGKVGSWLLIELMAQTIGLFAGLKNKKLGHGPKIGFLLGTRRFSTSVASLPLGAEVITEAVCSFYSDDELPSQFSCVCKYADAVVAEANLTVYQPKSLLPWKN